MGLLSGSDEFCIAELASERQSARNLVENSADDEIGMTNMAAVYAVEAKILRAGKRFTRATAIHAKQKILFQFGEPDWGDEFNQHLAQAIALAV